MIDDSYLKTVIEPQRKLNEGKEEPLVEVIKAAPRKQVTFSETDPIQPPLKAPKTNLVGGQEEANSIITESLLENSKEEAKESNSPFCDVSRIDQR